MRYLIGKHSITSLLIILLLSSSGLAQKYEVLIITGQNNHHWQSSSKIIKGIFDSSGMFKATIVTTPPKGEDMSGFKPEFSRYDLICLDYNGDPWPDETKKNFVDFVKKGGGLVLFHASDNSFPDWKEYNRMIGVGGWGGRTEKHGPIVYWENGEIKKDKSPGKGGSHGKQDNFVVHTRQPDHPILKGLPKSWMHTRDELYHSLRGPARNMEVLATAEQDPSGGGSGRQEPVLFTIKYGKGRIFHSVLGHVGKNNSNTIKCAGFIATLLRGAEWAITGDVTQKVSEDLPTASNTRIWKDLKAPE
ncbi:ThuA domain-containing protein [Fulvivirgaceae bacterium BMA10]|uniref:ThuA domain-containing protein n=1 Tax=Splendidivirga corallicola TaxID=3051826 RepID=A0ABT8KX89_9BACT|nr:ThuA domain-containing protein [Fulvivirgaceae bacterium BMA10]